MNIKPENLAVGDEIEITFDIGGATDTKRVVVQEMRDNKYVYLYNIGEPARYLSNVTHCLFLDYFWKMWLYQQPWRPSRQIISICRVA